MPVRTGEVGDRPTTVDGAAAAFRRTLPFVALLGLAAAIRILANDLSNFSAADETVYLRFARTLAHGGAYRDIIRQFVGDDSLWIFPPPLRWSYLGSAALYCVARGACRYRTLSTFSTGCGIAAVALTCWLAGRLFERRTALVATALMVTSPLQLALGRRALSDEFFCAAVLASVVAMLEWLERRQRVWLLAWIGLATVAFAAKELFLFIYPIVLSLWWLRERMIHWIWAVPPFLYFAVFCVLARDLGSFFRVASIVMSGASAPYAALMQSGPPQRLLIDYMAIAPLVTIAFIGAACSVLQAPRTGGQVGTLLVAAGILVVLSLVPSKNLRYVMAADPFMRLQVAAWLPNTRWTIAALVGNALIELALFYTIFIQFGVYDPVTNDLLRALKMVP